MKKKTNQNISQIKKIGKKNSFMANHSNIISYNKNKVNKLDNSLSTYLKNGNNKYDKSKNKIHINIYQKPLNYINKNEKKGKNPSTFQNKNKNDYLLMNISNEFNKSIDEGRKAINYKFCLQENKRFR